MEAIDGLLVVCDASVESEAVAMGLKVWEERGGELRLAAAAEEGWDWANVS